jgi:hypothetical protein
VQCPYSNLCALSSCVFAPWLNHNSTTHSQRRHPRRSGWNVNGDGVADLMLNVHGVGTMQATWIIL